MTELPFNLTDVDFLESGLDFSGITPVELENLVFHLLDEMGFSNIQWRKGGEGNSATDGGRDLEATFWSVRPGVSREEKYWFEVKYRTGQLEKHQVQSTVLNASGNDSKDNVVIITNKTVSNPTLDWLGEFQASHKTPVVTIWQGHDLEILLRKNARTLARFLPSSLAFSGRCKVIESKFSNLMLLPSGGELDELWEMRDSYYENPILTLAACLAEVAYGDTVKHPWGMEIDEARLVSVLATGVLNVFPFLIKFESLNRDQAVFSEGLSYLIQCLLVRCGSAIVAKVLFEPEQLAEKDRDLPVELRVIRYKPIIDSIYYDLAIHCSANHCMKLHHLSPEEKGSYFQRFTKLTERPEKDARYLVMQSIKDACKLGLVLKEQYCPLGDDEAETPDTLDGLRERLEFARLVISRRSDELLNSA